MGGIMKKFLWCATIILLVSTVFGVHSLIGAGMEDRILTFFKKTIKPAEPLLANDITIEKEFQPGTTHKIGLIELVQGQCYLQHKGQKTAYQAKKDMPLYEGDILITGENARIQARLDDKSTFSLAEYSRLALTRIVYDSLKNSRDSEANLTFGKVRFKMIKLSDESNFSINTPTAVAGVRGSDFALMVYNLDAPSAAFSGNFFATLFSVPAAHAELNLLSTALLTGQDSTLTFAGLSGPVQSVGPFAVSVAPAGAAASIGAAVAPAVATGILESVGPGLAYMAMPPWMEE